MQRLAKIVNNNFADISIAFAFWALLIIRFGYSFGTGDQSEFTPYALYLADNSLYKTDLFIQKLAENPVNERLFFCTFLSVFHHHLEIVCFLGHLFFTVLLLVGLQKICRQFIKSQLFSYLVIFILFFLAAGKLPGGATMYSNNFLADSVAHALCAWGFFFTLKNRLLSAALLLSSATLFHPLIGLFVTLLSFGGYFFHICIVKKMLPSRQLFIAMLIYIFTAGIYLFLLVPDVAKTLSDEEYYSIFFELRYPHHTLPSHFSKIGLAALIIFSFSGLYYFYRKQKMIFWFLLLQCVGFCIYAVGLEGFHLVEIGLTQWFRSSMWAYFFGLTALAAMAEKHIKIIQPNIYFYVSAICFSLLTVILLFAKPQSFPLNNPYEIFGHKYNSAEIVVSEKIREMKLTGTYILPFNFTAHKYYSRQSSFADYKTIPRKNANLVEWYGRMKLIYDLDTANHLHGFEAEASAQNFYQAIPDSNLMQLKSEGVDYLLTDAKMESAKVEFVFAEKQYQVYRIK